jgi:two-component system sensor histidine kinase DesK
MVEPPLATATASPGPDRVLGGYAPRRARLIGALWLLILIGPFTSAFELSEPDSYVAAVLIAVFTGCHLALFLGLSPVVRRREQVLVGAMVAIAIVLPAAYGEHFWLPLLFAGSAAVMTLPRRVGVVVLVGVNVYAVACGLISGWPADEIGDVLLSCALASMVVLTVSRLIGTIRELRIAEGRLAEAAVNEERLRFARDLHDLLGHSLSAVVVKSELAQRLVDGQPERARAELADIEQLTRAALTDVRETVSGYRDLSLAAEIEGARAALAAAGVECSVTPAERALPARVEAVLAWAVREGSTNVLRHARARHCAIVLAASTGTATLDLTDDGVGVAADAPFAGAGLQGLAERIAAAGGRLASGPAPGRGFRLHAELPIAG